MAAGDERHQGSEGELKEGSAGGQQAERDEEGSPKGPLLQPGHRGDMRQ